MQSHKNLKNDRAQQSTIYQNQDLKKIRVLKQNLVFISGITPIVANVTILKSKQFFGHYGKVQSIKLKKELYYGDKVNKRISFSAYVSFKSKLNAQIAILSLQDVKMNNMILKSCLGFTKICKSYLNGQSCANYKNCQYLHTLNFKEPFVSIQNKEQIKNLSKINLQSFLQNLTQKKLLRLIKQWNQESIENTFFPCNKKIIGYIFQQLSTKNQMYLNVQKRVLNFKQKDYFNTFQNSIEQQSKNCNKNYFKKLKNKNEEKEFINTLKIQDVCNLNQKILQNKFQDSKKKNQQNQFYAHNNRNCVQNFYESFNLNQLDKKSI